MDFAQKLDLNPDKVSVHLKSIIDETGFQDLSLFIEKVERCGVEETREALSTRLMEVFRDTGNVKAFSLLYELNYRMFFISILSRVRRHHYLLDANDVLQEVFVNIYKYPYKFRADKPQAFRNWAGMIIRNTILRFLRGIAKESILEVSVEEILEPADETQATPQEEMILKESEENCRRAWLIYLNLYLKEYNRLSERERKALHLVEVEGFSYREVSAEMNIKVENLKMVIFRARKKIIRNMERYLQGQTVPVREVTSQ